MTTAEPSQASRDHTTCLSTDEHPEFRGTAVEDTRQAMTFPESSQSLMGAFFSAEKASFESVQQKDAERKATHKDTERGRRGRISDRIYKIGSITPNLTKPSPPGIYPSYKETKLSKETILESALAWMEFVVWMLPKALYDASSPGTQQVFSKALRQAFALQSQDLGHIHAVVLESFMELLDAEPDHYRVHTPPSSNRNSQERNMSIAVDGSSMRQHGMDSSQSIASSSPKRKTSEDDCDTMPPVKFRRQS
ncbi:MAG: hypothetical protein M1819_007033 [Sarea resinae]|nr:MAG: hypothetical protein M1819_007033 [Sarea resinae]